MRLHVEPIRQVMNRYLVINPFPAVISTILAAWLVVAGLARPAVGYVLDGATILDMAVESLGTVQRLQVRQQIELPYLESPAAGRVIRETVRFQLPDTIRSDQLTELSQRIVIVSDHRHLTVIDGQIQSDGLHWMDWYLQLLWPRSRLKLHENLARKGVDVTVTSLGRFQDRVAYVVGAHYPDESVDQVWFDKERFLPLRWIITSAAGLSRSDNQRAEIVFGGWKKISKIFYPMLIEFYLDGELIRKIRVSDVQLNPSFPENLMSIEHLGASAIPPVGITEPEPDQSLDDIQKSIDEFKQKFE